MRTGVHIFSKWKKKYQFVQNDLLKKKLQKNFKEKEITSWHKVKTKSLKTNFKKRTGINPSFCLFFCCFCIKSSKWKPNDRFVQNDLLKKKKEITSWQNFFFFFFFNFFFFFLNKNLKNVQALTLFFASSLQSGKKMIGSWNFHSLKLLYKARR